MHQNDILLDSITNDTHHTEQVNKVRRAIYNQTSQKNSKGKKITFATTADTTIQFPLPTKQP